MKLIEIDESGVLNGGIRPVDLLRSVIESTQRMYRERGFARPWIGYVAVNDGVAVGTCPFKSPPVEGRVEIAYFTFPGYEGRGIATSMAAELVQIALRENPTLTVVAQTLPEENASTTVLRKLGFQPIGLVNHPEDGDVWEWEKRG